MGINEKFSKFSETPGVIRSASGYFHIHNALQSHGQPVARVSITETHPALTSKPPIPSPRSPSSDDIPLSSPTLLAPSTNIASCTSIDQSFYDNVQPLSLALVRSTEHLTTSSSQPKLLAVQALETVTHEPLTVKRIALSPNEAEIRWKANLIARYGKPPRNAPMVSPELSEDEARKDPRMVTRKISHDSLISTDSRESVMSATSFRAENKTRRYFNYWNG